MSEMLLKFFASLGILTCLVGGTALVGLAFKGVTWFVAKAWLDLKFERKHKAIEKKLNNWLATTDGLTDEQLQAWLERNRFMEHKK